MVCPTHPHAYIYTHVGGWDKLNVHQSMTESSIETIQYLSPKYLCLSLKPAYKFCKCIEIVKTGIVGG